MNLELPALTAPSFMHTIGLTLMHGCHFAIMWNAMTTINTVLFIISNTIIALLLHVALIKRLPISDEVLDLTSKY